MARALALAEQGLATAHPNPRVGCVLVRDGTVLAEGWHQRAGGPHAEAAALANLHAPATGATAYVTLEPCNHHGRTPPCSEALIKAGVARVVYAIGPQSAGQGRRRAATARGRSAGAVGAAGGRGQRAQCRLHQAHAPGPAAGPTEIGHEPGWAHGLERRPQ